MARILLVEDEAALVFALEDAFQAEQHDITSARNGVHGLKLAQGDDWDLLVLDLMLPQLDGFSLLRQLRQQNKTLPVLILTAKGQEADKLKGFRLGADDYLTKPFSVQELLARVRALLKRSRHAAPDMKTLTLNRITFDFQAMHATRSGKTLPFGARELDLLRYLAVHAGQVLTREQILEAVWRYDLDSAPTTRTVDNYLVKLRKKIEPQPSRPRHFITVHGKGYRFES